MPSSRKSKEHRPGKRVVDGARCRVIGGTHQGAMGIVQDVKTSKTGHVTITVLKPDGDRIKTLAKNVVVDDQAKRSRRVSP